MTRRIPACCLGAAAIVAYFFYFAGAGLQNGFSQDDLQNIYWSWTYPAWQLVRDTLLLFVPSPIYRTFGELVYLGVFELFGFSAYPYRLLCFALLAANLWLFYRLAARLTGSRETGVIAALLQAYHGRAIWLYFNTGFLFDHVCNFLYFALLNFYLLVRQRGRLLSPFATAVWAFLFILALGTKETALTLPVIILVWELLENPPREMRWLWREARIALLGAGINVVFLVSRVYAPHALASVDGYHPDLRLPVFLEHGKFFLNEYFYGAAWFTPVIAAGFVLLLFAVAWFSRQTGPRLGLALMLIGILPIVFIRQRGLDAAYIPWAGLSLFLAWSLVASSRRVSRDPYRAEALFVCVLLASVDIHQRHKPDPEDWLGQGREIGSVISQISALRLPLQHGSRVLFLKDPFPSFHYGTTFILRTLYRDESILIDRADKLGQPADFSRYDAILTWEDDRLRVVPSPSK